MNCSQASAQLHDHLDGTLSPAESASLQAHLETCADCRQSWQALEELRALTNSLPRAVSPQRDLWTGIQTSLRAAGDVSDAQKSGSRKIGGATLHWLAPLAAAAGVALAIGWSNLARPGANAPWHVASVAGAPRVDQRPIAATGELRVGQWLETDHQSRAQLAVGLIGEVSVEPNSRLRLVDASATDHRLELARGELRAVIWAPPRLFFVNTPSATAIDLGCAYTLKVDEQGAGELHVTSGYVALAHDGRESIIPAGQSCRTRRGAGPGTPYAADATIEFIAALDRFDFDPAHQASAATEILSAARPQDFVTLWHLLSRVPSAQRGAVFDALAKNHPPPASVTRNGIMANDEAMRLEWASALGLQTSGPAVRAR